MMERSSIILKPVGANRHALAIVLLFDENFKIPGTDSADGRVAARTVQRTY